MRRAAINRAMATKNQIDALKGIGAGSVRMCNCGSAAFRIFGASPSVVGRCVSLGWAKWPKGPTGEQTCELTDAGRAALAAAE